MKTQINITEDGILKYPPHKHSYWEIMIYLSGEGFLYTQEKNIPFKAGTVVIVPPETIHGSVSKNGFKNISVGGAFGDEIVCKAPIAIQDNANEDGVAIAKIIYHNRFSEEALLNLLCSSLLCLLHKYIKPEHGVYYAVHKCIKTIKSSAYDTEMNLSEILKSSGYAEDYIRTKFKEYTGKTPTAFLNEIRMERAKFLIEIYGKNLLLSEIMLKCGFYDYAYFSKRFKQYCGISPSEYVRRCCISKFLKM